MCQVACCTGCCVASHEMIGMIWIVGNNAKAEGAGSASMSKAEVDGYPGKAD